MNDEQTFQALNLTVTPLLKFSTDAPNRVLIRLDNSGELHVYDPALVRRVLYALQASGDVPAYVNLEEVLRATRDVELRGLPISHGE